MPPQVHLYSRLPYNQSRSDLEEAIDEHFAGRAEVTGGGSGTKGWNVDIELLNDAVDFSAFVQELVRYLRLMGVPSDSYLNLFPAGWVEGMPVARTNVFGGPAGA
jgi:hypothetical protein